MDQIRRRRQRDAYQRDPRFRMCWESANLLVVEDGSISEFLHANILAGTRPRSATNRVTIMSMLKIPMSRICCLAIDPESLL